MTISRFKFVLWNYGRSFQDMTELCKKFNDKYECSYFHFTQQIAPKTQNPHVDGYYEYPTPRRWTGEVKKMKKIFDLPFADKHANKAFDQSSGHFGDVQTAKGTAGENMDYSENPTATTELIQWGEPGKGQGFRQDLSEYNDALQASEMSAESIALADPAKYHQYARTFHKIEDITLRKRFRTEMTEGLWIFGPTAAGKSHKAFEGYHPDTHYLWKLNDNGWQDGYRGQETVIINDFRGKGIDYDMMLNLVDKWPYTIPQRGKEPFPFLAKKVIITSPMSPDQVYHRRHASDGIEQLLRRFQIVEKKDPSSEGVVLPSEHFIAKSSQSSGSANFWSDITQYDCYD